MPILLSLFTSTCPPLYFGPLFCLLPIRNGLGFLAQEEKARKKGCDRDIINYIGVEQVAKETETEIIPYKRIIGNIGQITWFFREGMGKLCDFASITHSDIHWLIEEKTINDCRWTIHCLMN